MRILIRLVRGPGKHEPLWAEVAPDATIGDLADHLAHVVGRRPGMTINGLDRRQLVRDSGPRSGSVVELTDVQDNDHPHRVAPVRIALTVLDGRSSDLIRELDYGPNDLGSVEVNVSDRAELLPRSDARVLVNGQPTIGSRQLCDGDLVSILGEASPHTPASWDIRSTTTAFALEISGPLDPPVRGPFSQHRPTPRVHDELIPATITSAPAPEAVRAPGLPVLSAMVPLLFGVVLWVTTRSIASAVFILFSFVYVVAAGIESRIEFRKDTRHREKEFRRATARLIDVLKDAQEQEACFIDRTTPTLDEVLEMIESRSQRIWERCVDDTTGGFLRVRLGVAYRPGLTRIEGPKTGRSDLIEWFETQLAEVFETDLPVTIDMGDGAGLSLVGRHELTAGLARWIVLQLVTVIGPDLLRVVVVSSTDRSTEWDWVPWLPHHGRPSRAAKVLVVVDGAGDHEVARVLDALDGTDVSFLWLATRRGDVPRLVAQSLEMAPNGGTALVRVRASDPSIFELTTITSMEHDAVASSIAMDMATRLAPLVAERLLEPTHVDALDSPNLTDVVGPVEIDDPRTILDAWRASSSGSRLSAPLARSGSGIIEIDLTSDGPHALVAGTTGAGKSELLRTWLMSLALHHPPDRLTFLLIDYKGGSAFGPLAQLPHAVGLITDLDSELADRAIISLRAELRAREVWLAGESVGSVSEAEGIEGRPPALVVVVDEFATLAKELPGMIDELVDIAQRGRSLGIHLVLATQRPHGVVGESIRANTSIRIALRVADSSDSSDVIDSPDAAMIARDAPGSAIVRIGQARSGTVRFAYSSAPFTPMAKVRSGALTLDDPIQGRLDGPGETEIDLATRSINTAFESSSIPLPTPPWVAPLASEIELASVPHRGPANQLPIGMQDRPDLQRVVPLCIDLDSGPGVVVFGAPGTGRSMALATIAESMAHRLEMSVIHSIGASIGHASDSIPITDRERVMRVLRGACRERPEADPTRTMILIDDMATFENHYGSINRGEAMALIERICRQGPPIRTNLVVGASRRMDLPATTAVGFVHQIVLGLASADEASLLGVPTSLAGDLPAGRGIHDGHWVQIASGRGCNACGSVDNHRVSRLPERIPLAAIRNDTLDPTADRQQGSATDWRIPIGLGTDDLAPRYLDLSHSHGLVAGPRRSGRSTALSTIATSWRTSARQGIQRVTVLVEPASLRRSEPADPVWDERVSIVVSAHDSVDGSRLRTLSEDLGRAVERGVEVLIAVEELPALVESTSGDDVGQFLQHMMALAANGAMRVVLAGEIDALNRCYSQPFNEVRAGRTGLLLRPDTDIHGSLLGCELGRREELVPRPGQGWLVTVGDATPVQVALTDDA